MAKINWTAESEQWLRDISIKSHQTQNSGLFFVSGRVIVNVVSKIR